MFGGAIEEGLVFRARTQGMARTRGMLICKQQRTSSLPCLGHAQSAPKCRGCLKSSGGDNLNSLFFD